MSASAKRKLNAASLLSAFLVAGLIGGVTASWFLIALAGLLVAAVVAGDIRR